MEDRTQILLVDPAAFLYEVTVNPAFSDIEWVRCSSIENRPSPGAAPETGMLITVHHRGETEILGDPATRSAELMPGVPWLAIATAGSEQGERLVQAGADDYLLAPVETVRLRRSIDRFLEFRRLSVRNDVLVDRVRIMEDCHALAHCLEPGQLYPLALEILLRATEREKGFVLFQREGSEQGTAAAVRGFAELEAPELSRCLVNDKRVAPDDFEGVHVLDRGPLHDSLRSAEVDVSSLLTVSMAGEGEHSGVIAVLDCGMPFTARDVERAETVGRHGIPALDNADTYASAKERAFVDDVTEAYNARYLLDACEREIHRSERYGTPLSVLFLDLDHFKRVNDEHGHLAGSKMLRRLCRLLEEKVREVDTLARYGGDEFTILLVDTDHAEALAVAERIRQGVADETFELEGEARLGLTVSIGVSTCPLQATDRDRLIDAADKAMYRAKSLGRNRVCSASELS